MAEDHRRRDPPRPLNLRLPLSAAYEAMEISTTQRAMNSSCKTEHRPCQDRRWSLWRSPYVWASSSPTFLVATNAVAARRAILPRCRNQGMHPADPGSGAGTPATALGGDRCSGPPRYYLTSESLHSWATPFRVIRSARNRPGTGRDEAICG